MMNKTIILTAMSVVVGLTARADYRVTGIVDNNGGTRVYLVSHNGVTTDTVASSLTADGSFTFSGRLADGPMAAEILSDGSRMSVPVMLEDGYVYAVKADVKAPLGWSVESDSPLQGVRNEFHKYELDYKHCCDSVEREYKANYDLSDYFWKVQLRGALQDERKKHEVRRDAFVQANDNLVSASLLFADLRRLVSDKTVHEKYAMLGPVARATGQGRALEAEAARMSRIVVGGTPPDFTMATPTGEKLSLHGVKGKVKILDFWASWCGPCRAENPTLRKLYAEYAPKGLEIISVSLDTDRDAWVKAVEDDGMTWKHVSELGEGSTPQSVFNVFAIPHIFVLDENNRIIAEKLRGEKLEEFIAGQFKD